MGDKIIMKNHILTQVHLVNTNKNSDLWLMHNKSQGLMQLKTASILDGEPKHLYITSDEEIKEGDWALNIRTGQIGRCIKDKSVHSDAIVLSNKLASFTVHKDNCRKIAATTNKELWPRAWNDDKNKNPLHIFGDVVIHKIPQSFIELYIEKYNDGSPIKQVWLKYYWEPFSGIEQLPPKLKLNPDDSIIWKLEEERMYTENDMTLAYAAGLTKGKEINQLPTPRVHFKEWFNKHYPK